MKYIYTTIFILIANVSFTQNIDTIDLNKPLARVSENNRTFCSYFLRIRINNICECSIANVNTDIRAFCDYDKMAEIEILDILEDYTEDSVSLSKIKKIKYMIIPNLVNLPKDTIINIVADRTFSYNYLAYAFSIGENYYIIKRNLRYVRGSAGLIGKGIEECPKSILWLWNKGLISYNVANKFSNNPEHNYYLQCIKKLKLMRKKNVLLE